MSGEPLNLQNKRFSKLLVIDISHRQPSKYGIRLIWKCVCDCGETTFVRTDALRSGSTRSCGCLLKQWYKDMKVRRPLNWKHGMCYSQFYRKYKGILRRCNNKNDHNYLKYGKKGIKCLWKSFEEFKDDMYESYLEHLKEHGKKQTTIDRIDGTGHYCKENCRWATIKQQQRNRKNNFLISYLGETKCLTEWAEEFKIPNMTLQARIKRYKWPIQRAFTEPVGLFHGKNKL